MNTALIIPSLNAGPNWKKVLNAVDTQTRQPDRKILLDSCSTDSTTALAEQHGFEIHTIHPGKFNHGLTRQYGIEACPDTDIIVFLTQDAIPATTDAFARLLSAFETPQIASAYGRQRPRPNATATEIFARWSNYPPESKIKRESDIPAMGLQTAFCSNSFAAWRRTALEQIGGFPKTDFGEDMLAAAKLILAGHTIAYCAGAKVIHSHPSTFCETFLRGQQIGTLHRQHPWLTSCFGTPEETGTHHLRSGIGFLAKKSPLRIPGFILQSATKFLGFLSRKCRVS